MKETLFERLRNDIFYQKLLSEAIKQNKNDYMHRTLYEAYNYKFIDSKTGRELYFKIFMHLK